MTRPTESTAPLQLQMTTQLNKPPVDYMGMLGAVVDHPLYNAAQMIPFANIPLNALAYGSHMDRGMYDDAKWDSAGMLPGVGLIKGAKTLNALREWGPTVLGLAKNYPGAMMRTAVSAPGDMVNALQMMGRMTARQVGNVAQVKQGIDATTPVAQAAERIIND